MHVSSSFAYERISIQSIRKDKLPGRGCGSTSAAAAPSDSMNRRNSWLKPTYGLATAFSPSCCSYCDALSAAEASSEPVTTARAALPASTAFCAYRSAPMLEQQTPAVETISQGGHFKSPCTIAAWLGVN